MEPQTAGGVGLGQLVVAMGREGMEVSHKVLVQCPERAVASPNQNDGVG